MRIECNYSQTKIEKLKLTKKNNIDYIRKNVENNIYEYFEDFEKDLKKMFVYSLLYRCNSAASYSYVLEQY